MSRSARLAMMVALGLFFEAAAGCRRAGHGEKAITSVRVRKLERMTGAAASGGRYSATIEPATRVDVAFKVGGYVEWIAKTSGGRVLQEGDPVESGQRLASVRQTDYFQKRDQAKAALAGAQAAAAQAKIDFDRAAHLESKQDIAKAELDGAKAKLATTTAQVDGTRAQLEEAQTAIADSTLRSPMDGIVAKRGVEVGVLAGPGTVAFSIVDVRSVKVVFGVPDTILTKMKLGMSQAVTTEAYRGEIFTGSITRIAPVADARSRVFEIEVTLPNPDQRLKAGMVAALNLRDSAALSPSAPMVQLSAIVHAPGGPQRYAVFVVENQEGRTVARSREVKLGDFMGNIVPVTEGLAVGQEVVVAGASFLSDGETVRVLP
jgi:RND family efflux transporter MFP subunit